jgi:hypothetical protein
VKYSAICEETGFLGGRRNSNSLWVAGCAFQAVI